MTQQQGAQQVDIVPLGEGTGADMAGQDMKFTSSRLSILAGKLFQVDTKVNQGLRKVGQFAMSGYPQPQVIILGITQCLIVKTNQGKYLSAEHDG